MGYSVKQYLCEFYRVSDRFLDIHCIIANTFYGASPFYILVSSILQSANLFELDMQMNTETLILLNRKRELTLSHKTTNKFISD